jgi:PAS domain-containing protein
MDLEKIKQNLRLRSGRPKRAKQPIHPVNGHVIGSGQPNGKPIGPGHTDSTKKRVEQGGAQKQTSNQVDGGETNVAQPKQSPTPAPAAQKQQADQKSPEHHNEPDANPVPAEISEGSESSDFDLRPPAPRRKPPSLEATAELLFSSGHLNSILHDAQGLSRFTAFLARYKPEYQHLVIGYLETQKAIKAVEYANAVAQDALPKDTPITKLTQQPRPDSAAQLNKSFQEASSNAFLALVGTALPMFVTYNLIKTASECLRNEVAGRQSSIMQNLVGGLSEVFCITDPNQEDNPIIYASEGFYRYTQYSTDEVIGRNCRFLQGPKTIRETVRRLKEASLKGDEVRTTQLDLSLRARIQAPSFANVVPRFAKLFSTINVMEPPF